MSADWQMSADDYQDLFDEWVEDYKVDLKGGIEADAMSREQYEMLLELDRKNLVWTDHGTCEDNKISPGFNLLGDIPLLSQKATGCGCWQSFVFYIAEVPFDGTKDDTTASWIDVSATLPCPKCNADGEGDGDPECDEPDCMGDGYITYYFD